MASFPFRAWASVPGTVVGERDRARSFFSLVFTAKRLAEAGRDRDWILALKFFDNIHLRPRSSNPCWEAHGVRSPHEFPIPRTAFSSK